MLAFTDKIKNLMLPQLASLLFFSRTRPLDLNFKFWNISWYYIFQATEQFILEHLTIKFNGLRDKCFISTKHVILLFMYLKGDKDDSLPFKG